MARPTLGVKLPKNRDGGIAVPYDKSAGEWGAHVEALGYESIWTTEGWGSDAFVDLGDVLAATDDLLAGTAIVNVFSRTPAVLAMAATTLAAKSDGRMILGLGTSHERRIEDFHGMDYHRPVRRAHEVIEVLDLMTRSDEDSVDYDGQLLSIRDVPPMAPAFPIYAAALGDANLRMTGRLADGWIPHLVPVQQLEPSFEVIAAAANERGRDPDDIAVCPQILAAVSDEDPAAAKRQIRTFLASYVGRMPNYRHNVAETFPEETEAVAEAWSRDEDEAIDLVTDEMVDAVGVAGTTDEARDRLREIIDMDVIDRPLLYAAEIGGREFIHETIEQLAPAHL